MIVALLFSLIAFTALDGRALYLAPSQIVGIREVVRGECAAKGRAIIVTLSGGFCVRETAAEAARKLEHA